MYLRSSSIVEGVKPRLNISDKIINNTFIYDQITVSDEQIDHRLSMELVGNQHSQKSHSSRIEIILFAKNVNTRRLHNSKTF